MASLASPSLPLTSHWQPVLEHLPGWAPGNRGPGLQLLLRLGSFFHPLFPQATFAGLQPLYFFAELIHPAHALCITKRNATFNAWFQIQTSLYSCSLHRGWNLVVMPTCNLSAKVWSHGTSTIPLGPGCSAEASNWFLSHCPSLFPWIATLPFRYGSRVASSVLWSTWRFHGRILGKTGFGEQWDLSKVQCYRADPLTHSFSSGKLISVVWKWIVIPGGLQTTIGSWHP